MRAAALLLLAGCSTIFGLSDPHLVPDAAGGDASGGDADLADAAPGHCVTIADCPTSACLPSTVCANDADVAWRDSTATANQACTMAMPCNTLNDALATNRPYIRFHGALRPMSSLSQDVSIYGEPNARFSNANLQTSANVGLYDLEIASACVQVMSGSLTAVHINLHACAGVGITANGALTLDRSTIALNRGGIAIASPTFSITNNFIIYNGLPGGGGSSVGGIAITSPAADPTSQIAFNTIAENATASIGNVAGGLYCNIQTFTALANVIVHNSAGGSTTTLDANTAGACQQAASIVQVSDDVGFAGVASGDFHVTAISELVDAAQVIVGPPDDIDGEPRPFGSGYDIGADEYHP